MSNLTIVQRQIKNATILDLAGNIKIGEESVVLRQTIRRLIAEGETQIVINLADVSTIDSSGLGELVSGYVALEKNGGELKLLNLTDRVSELMMITKLLTVFEVYEDEEIAVNSFGNVPEKAGLSKTASVTGKPDGTLLSQ